MSPTRLAKPISDLERWYACLGQIVPQLPELGHLDLVSLGDNWSHLHTSTSHELIHIRQGQGKLIIRSTSAPVQAGDVFVIAAGTPHRDLRMSDADYSAFYIHFDWPAADALLRKVDSLQLLGLSDHAKSLCRARMIEIEQTYLHHGSDIEPLLALQTAELVLSLCRLGLTLRASHQSAADSPGTQRRRQLAWEVRQHLEKHLTEPLRLDQLAARFGVSSFHLCRTFATEYRLGLTDTLTQLRIERAKLLLADRSLSMKQIAQQCGFTNANYFAKAFRRTTGHSPSDYRLQIRV